MQRMKQAVQRQETQEQGHYHISSKSAGVIAEAEYVGHLEGRLLSFGVIFQCVSSKSLASGPVVFGLVNWLQMGPVGWTG